MNVDGNRGPISISDMNLEFLLGGIADNHELLIWGKSVDRNALMWNLIE